MVSEPSLRAVGLARSPRVRTAPGPLGRIGLRARVAALHSTGQLQVRRAFGEPSAVDGAATNTPSMFRECNERLHNPSRYS
jgi:hypothetical protein